MNKKIKGKELLLRTLKHERIDSVPWVPFAEVHAGKLKGYSALEVLKDEEKLFSILAPAQEKFVRLFALLEPFLPQSAAAVKKIFAQKNLEKAPLLFPKIER